MAKTNGIKVHVYGDYDNKQIDKAIKDLKSLRENGEGMGSAMAVQGAKLQAFGAATAAVGAKLTKGLTLPIVGVATAAVIAGADFERSMNKVKAISGATGADFEALKNQAKDLGRTTGFSASEAANAMSFLAMAGFKTNEILGAMPGTLNLAAAGNLDLARSADIASNILTGYGLEVNQLDHAVDVLAKTFTSSNTDLEQLGEAFKYAGPVAASAGVQFEQAAAAIGLMGNAGIQGSMAGTSLRGAISRLLNPTSQVSASLERLGITVTDSAGKLLPLDQIVQQLGASGATTGDYMQIFGQRAGPAMAALVRQGSTALVNLTTDLENSGGTAQEIADTQLEGFHGALIRLKSAFEAAMIAIAESGLLEKATSLIEGLVDVVATLALFVEKLPKPIKDFGFVLAAAAAAAGPLLWILGKFIGVIGAIMVKLAVANAKVISFGASIRSLGAVSTTAAAQVGTGFGAIGAAAVMNMGLASRAVNVAIASFRGLVIAARTLLVSLGPIGIAMIALGAAYSIMAGRAAAAEHKVSELRQAIESTGDASKAAVLDAMIKQLVELEYQVNFSTRTIVEQFEEIGIGLDDAAIALIGTNKEFQTFIGTVDEYARAAGYGNAETVFLTKRLREQRQAYLDATDGAGRTQKGMEATANAARKLGISVGDASGGLDGFADSLDDVEGEAGEAETAIKKLSDMFKIFDANVAAIRARDAFTSYMRDFKNNLAKGNRSLLENSAAAEKNRDTVISAFDKKKTEILAWAEANGKGQDDVDRKWDKFTRNFKKRLTSEGFKAKDIEQFFGSKYLDVASVNVAAEMNRQITSMALKNEHQARTSFNNVGRAIGEGTTAGVKSYQETLWADVRKMMEGAKNAAKSELESSSPSRVFMRIGADVVAGFVKGMADKKEKVRKEAKETLVDAVKDAFQKGVSELKSKLDEARNYAMGWRNRMIGLLNLGTAFSAAQDKDKAEADALKQLRDAEESLSDARRDLEAAETDDAKKAAQSRVDAQLKVMTDAQGAYQAAAAAAATNWVDEFKDQLTKASNFAALLQQLKSAGAHEMLVQQIAEAGVDAGTAMAHDLINGGAAGTGGLIDQFNTDFKTFDKQVTELGVDFANDWAFAVGPKMGNLTAAKTLAAFRKEFGPDGPGRARLMGIMDRLAASMSRTARITVVVDQVAGSRINVDGARADGGRVWPGGTFLVGENGPELFQPSSAGMIIPNNQITPTRLSGSSGGAGTTINLTVNAGMGTQGAEVGRQIVDAISAYSRRNGPVYVSA
jgi:TP901 family phage tail tape measure protein